MEKKLPVPVMIETLSDLERFASEIKSEGSLAVDIESDGFYVYHEKVCLIQVTTSRGDFIIDPLSVKDLSPLGPALRNPKVVKIFHAGEYDVACLKRDFGFQVKNVFDTMIASRTLGEERLGLARLIEKHFKIKLSKKLQRANWGRRPLTPEQVMYARLDTHFLHALRDILLKELKKKGLLQDAKDAFDRLERSEHSERVFHPEDFWHMKGTRDLSAQKRAVLRGLFLYREKKAASLDRAPFRVLSEQILFRLAEKCPKTPEILKNMKGITPYLFNHFGRDIVKAVVAGLSAAPIEKPPERNHRQRWDPDTMRRYEALREWRKKTAAGRGVNPVVILATEELRNIAQAPLKENAPADWLTSLTEHKRSAYGKEIMEILNRPRPLKKHRRRRRKSGRDKAQEIANK